MRDESTPFSGDYSGREWLNETPAQRKTHAAKAKRTSKRREYDRNHRPTMSHQEARTLELAGRAIHVFPRLELVRVDGYKLYRLV